MKKNKKIIIIVITILLLITISVITCFYFIKDINKENNLKTENVVSMQFTLTKDLDEMNPCAALRFSGSNIDSSKIPLFCSQEAYIKNGLPKVIRVLITTYVEANQDVTHIYINGAEKLRPDFCKK